MVLILQRNVVRNITNYTRYLSFHKDLQVDVHHRNSSGSSGGSTSAKQDRSFRGAAGGSVAASGNRSPEFGLVAEVLQEGNHPWEDLLSFLVTAVYLRKSVALVPP